MIKAPSSLQDPRRGLYGKRKTEWTWLCAKALDGSGGVVDSGSGRPDSGAGSTVVFESGSHQIGLINLVAKCAGARSAGNPHAACDAEGAGNGVNGPPRQLSTLPRLNPIDALRYE